MAGQGNLPSLSPPWAVTLGAYENAYSNRVTSSTPNSAPEEPLPHTAPTLVNDALCDEFALPPLVITQRPPVENQALPEVLLKAKMMLERQQVQQGHQGIRVDQPELRTGHDLNLQRQLHPQ